MRLAESGEPKGTSPVSFSLALLRSPSFDLPALLSFSVSLRLWPAARSKAFWEATVLLPSFSSSSTSSLFVRALTVTGSLPFLAILSSLPAPRMTSILGRANGGAEARDLEVALHLSGWVVQKKA